MTLSLAAGSVSIEWVKYALYTELKNIPKEKNVPQISSSRKVSTPICIVVFDSHYIHRFSIYFLSPLSVIVNILPLYLIHILDIDF